MTNVLILGGTGWLSGRVARAWLDAGASVTCLARGGRPAPDGAELIIADRAEPGAYVAVADRASGTRSSRSPRSPSTWPPPSTLSPRALGTGRTCRRCRPTRPTTRSAPTRAHRSANPPSPGTNTTTPARRRRPRHPSVAASAIVRRSCGRDSSSDRATRPTASATGSAGSRSPATGPSSHRRSRDCSAQVIDVDDLAAVRRGARRASGGSGTANAIGDTHPARRPARARARHRGAHRHRSSRPTTSGSIAHDVAALDGTALAAAVAAARHAGLLHAVERAHTAPPAVGSAASATRSSARSPTSASAAWTASADRD